MSNFSENKFVTLHAVEPLPETDGEQTDKRAFEPKGVGNSNTQESPEKRPTLEFRAFKDMKVGELFKLAKDGQMSKALIISFIANDPRPPKVQSKELSRDFDLVMATLAKTKSEKTISELLTETDLRAEIAAIIPPQPTIRRTMEYTSEVKSQLGKAAEILTDDLKAYAEAKKISLKEQNVVFATLRKLIRTASNSSLSERDKTRENVKQTLLFLQSLKESDLLRPEALDHEILMRDPNAKSEANIFVNGKFKFALQNFYRQYHIDLQKLEDYAEQFQPPEANSSEVMPDRVIKVLEYIAQGWGPKAGGEGFNIEDSWSQWTGGTQFAEDGKGAGNRLFPGEIKGSHIKI